MPVPDQERGPREGDPHPIPLAGYEGSVPLRRVDTTLIAYIDFLNDRPLGIVRACADRLAEQLREDGGADLLVAPEAGAIALCFMVAERLGVPHVIARKRSREYMPTSALSVPVQSITALRPELLVFDDASVDRLKGRRVVLIDTVISTGSTMEAIHKLSEAAGATVIRRAVAFTEGEQPAANVDVLSLGALPTFPA